MDYKEWTNKAINIIKSRIPPQYEFTLKSLFEIWEWETLSNEEKRSFGRFFAGEVREGRIEEVKIVEKTRSNHTQYKKI